MKKILSFLTTIALFGSTTTAVISCTTGPNMHHKNPDYEGEEINQSEETKLAISQAIQERMKAAVLTDVYHINSQQLQRVLFDRGSSETTNLETVYRTYFNENSLASSVDQTNPIDLIGNRGYQGGLIGLIMDQLNLSDALKQILVSLFQIDLDSQAFKDQVMGILTLVNDVLQGFNTQVLVDELPLLLGMIPSDLFSQIPDLIANTVSDVVQSIIDNFASANTVNPILDALVSGSDLTRFSDVTISQLHDAFFVNLTNFLGYGIVADFTEFSDVDAIDYDALGTWWYTNASQLPTFSFATNAPKAMEKVISSLAILNLLLSVYQTKDVVASDDQHLFSTEMTNEEFVTNLHTQQVNTFDFDLTRFQAGQLIDNLTYFFGTNPTEGRLRFTKFFYAWMFNGDLSSDDQQIPSFWKLIFATLKANPDYNATVVEKMPAFYHETLAVRVLQPMLNNQALQPIGEDQSENPTYWSIVNDDGLTGLQTFMNQVMVSFDQTPMNRVYEGNLNPLIDSLEELLGAEKMTEVHNNLELLMGPSYELNVNNLLGIRLNRVLGILGVAGLPTDENGLVPDYAGYYLNRSLRQLVDDLGNNFQFDTNLENGLSQYFLDFSVVKEMFTTLLYNNQINENKGFLADFLEALVKEEPLTNLLGYQENNRLVRQNSFLGQLMHFFIPDLTTVEGEEYNLDQDLRNKQDNFNWLVNGIMGVLVNVMRPTDYSQFIQQILMIDGVFEIQERLEYFKKTMNIQSGEYIININLGLVKPTLDYQTIMNTISYSFVFAKDNEADDYQFTLFRKN